MHRSNILAFANLWQLLLDLIFLTISFLCSYLFTDCLVILMPLNNYYWILVIFAPMWILIMNFFRMYNKTTFNYYDRAIKNVFISTLLASTSILSLALLIKTINLDRGFFITYVISNMFLLITERFLFINISNHFKNKNTKNVIIVGATKLALKYCSYLKKTNINSNILGYVHIENDFRLTAKKNFGSILNLAEILQKNIIDEVVFALPRDYKGEIEKYILLCEEMGLVVRVLVETYDLKISKVHVASIGPIPMLTFHSFSLNPVQLTLKRILDIIGSIIGIIITALITPFIIVAIKADSPGPIFFSQDRVGLNGRIFKLYKFRSMYIEAEDLKQELMQHNQIENGLMFKLKNDPRITRIGAFLRMTSLDELPQFYNVLKGEMSLVGTRPPTRDEVIKYKTLHHRRISIKPGITGMWQVKGRSEVVDFDEVVKLDTEYIDKWSFGLDIKIILLTLVVVFKKKGAM